MRCKCQLSRAFALCRLSDLLAEDEAVLLKINVHAAGRDQIHLIQNQKEDQVDLKCTPHTPGKRHRQRCKRCQGETSSAAKQ